MSRYADYIKEDLKKFKVEGLDLAHVESTMRNEHSTLDHLSRRAFAGVVKRAVADLRHPEHVCDHCWRSKPEYRLIAGNHVAPAPHVAKQQEVGVVQGFSDDGRDNNVQVKWDSGEVSWYAPDELVGPLDEAAVAGRRKEAKVESKLVEEELAEEYDHLEPKKKGFRKRVAKHLAFMHANACIEDLVDKRLFDEYADAAVKEFTKAFAEAMKNAVKS